MRFIDAPLLIRQIIIFSFIITFVLSIIGLFTSVRLCKKRAYIMLSSIMFIFSFVVVFLTMRGSYLYRINMRVFEPSFTILKLPIWLYYVVLLLLFIGTIVGLVSAVIWNKKHISPISIKESADTLPAGICFYEESGLIRLANTEMNNLCVLTTGNTLLNGKDFWLKITHGELEGNCQSLQTGDKTIIEYGDCKVVSFKKYTHEIDGKIVYEIVAVNISERYRLTRELEKKLDELKKINNRLVVYGKNVAELTKEKEHLAAKTRIHNDMGKLLLTTKRKLNTSLTEAEGKELVSFWKAEITALKSVRKVSKNSNIKVIEDAAKLVGVNLIFEGKLPKPDTIREKILTHAMHECLTNTVSHANGKNMTVVVSEKNDLYTISITNDGEKPKGVIVEGGGLTDLRSLVERENGKMIISSTPHFELLIELSQGEKI